MRPEDLRLSEHFTLRELCRSNTADRLKIYNWPEQAAVIANLARVCEGILEPVRQHYGVPFSPSSGFRSLALNRALGSRDTSQHVLGQAVDLEIPGVANYDLARWMEENLPLFDQLILEFYTPGQPTSGWVHCSLRPGSGNRQEVLTIGRGGVRPGLHR